MAQDLSLVGIITDSMLVDANLLSEVLGFGPNTYSVGLSVDGSEPSRHYAFHAASNQVTVDVLTGVSPLPDIIWTDYGLTEARVLEIQAAVILSSKTAVVQWGLPHFEEVIANNSLMKMIPEEVV